MEILRILVADSLSEEGLSYLFSQPGIEVVNRPSMKPGELLEAVSDVHALLVRSKSKVTAEILSAAKNLRVVGRAGAGVDNIDVATATRLGVLVMNTPGGNSISVAEHAFAMMLAAARNIVAADNSLRQGKWEKSRFMGRELQGKTLGILGLGKIGSVLARRALAFEMRVLAYDPYVGEQYAEDLGVHLTDFDSVLAESDFLSLHLPGGESTRGILNQHNLSRMKPGAVVLNAARGSLINEEDLAASIENGHLAGAGLDVFEDEPNVNSRLKALDRVVMTPHIAGSTLEAQAVVGLEIARQVVDYLRDNIISNAVNFPSIELTETGRIGAYLSLGQRLGSLIAQLASIRVAEVGVRYYGELTQIDYRAVSSYILGAVLAPFLSEPVNPVNARSRAKERGISLVETVSSRQRGHSNLISIQLRSSSGEVEWVEGALLHGGTHWIVSLYGMPIEAPLGDHILVIRNDDTPGVIGQVGTILGRHSVNIASFVLGRDRDSRQAVGVCNVDDPPAGATLSEIVKIPAVRFARLVRLES